MTGRAIVILVVAMTGLVAPALGAASLEAWRAPPIDFSHAGYRGGGVAPPQPPADIVVKPGRGDDTDRIMAAIRLVERLPADAEGRRGVVQLAAGEFQVERRIRLAVGGVVLRGQGSGEGGTVLVGTGHDRSALITVGGGPAATEAPAPERRLIGDTAVGAMTVTVESIAGLAVGDEIAIRRPSTQAWIALLGMDAFAGWRPETWLNWKPGSRDIVWDRRILAINGRAVTLDAPLTTALEAAYGGGLLRVGPSARRIREVGVEHLRLVSRSDPQRPADEDHSWFGVILNGVEDGWVRDVAARGFAGSAVYLGAASRRITVQDVEAFDPVSELGGLRRRVFYTAGQQGLFLRCRSRDGIHDFGLGHAAAGPNVFLGCVAEDAHGDSGGLESWASGALFDGVRVRGDALTLTHRGRDGQGVGWSAANSVLWNCEATHLEVRNPPGATNAAIGCRGESSGDGVRQDPRVQPGRDFHRAAPQDPASLYQAQLVARLGPGALAALDPVVPPAAATRTRVLAEADIKAYRAGLPKPGPGRPLVREQGGFAIDGRPAWGRRVGFSFFQAQMVPALAPAYGPAITRFAPGLEGVGLTDDLEALAAGLQPGDVVHHNYGLWYDRRRIDHDFYGSPDQRTGEVWGPFMELPWARSGQGRAWDGLSKYDLTRFNPWFFDRLRTFAGLAEQRGVVLYHRLYFQHWLLESRAHYVDFPWRPVNALQATGMPAEVPAAETFWDVSDPVRRDLHRRYIRHTLETLKHRRNVVIGLDPEYTGPLSFVQFWLDVIAEWEAETGASVWVALEAPKAQLDAILDDPVRSRTVDAVGFHHWTYRPDGTLFAINGGLNLAPRQQVDAIARPHDLAGGIAEAEVRKTLWRSTPAMRYRAWREYRDRDPELVILNGEDAFPDLSRAVEALVPASRRRGMRPDESLVRPNASSWGLASRDSGAMVYSVEGRPVRLTQPLSAGRVVRWVGAGAREAIETRLAPGATDLSPPPALAGRPWAAWLAP